MLHLELEKEVCHQEIFGAVYHLVPSSCQDPSFPVISNDFVFISFSGSLIAVAQINTFEMDSFKDFFPTFFYHNSQQNKSTLHHQHTDPYVP